MLVVVLVVVDGGIAELHPDDLQQQIRRTVLSTVVKDEELEARKHLPSEPRIEGSLLPAATEVVVHVGAPFPIILRTLIRESLVVNARIEVVL